MWTFENVHTLFIFLFAEVTCSIFVNFLTVRYSEVSLSWKQNFLPFLSFLSLAFVNQTLVIQALYVSFIYTFAAIR